MRSIILVGAGGHCASCIEVIESTGKWEISGLVDTPEHLGERLLGYEIIATDADLPKLAARFDDALITVGQLANPEPRRRLLNILSKAGFELPVIISATAVVSRRANAGAGTIVMHQAFVNAGVEVGKNCIINTGAIIEHDVSIGDHCHISTGARVNGGCKVGGSSFIGSGAVLRNGISIVSGCVIGAGAVVTKDISEAGTYLGCPARKTA